MRTFVATLAPVSNRGVPPASFLNALIDWGRKAPDRLFVHMKSADRPEDVYTNVKPQLGPWHGEVDSPEFILHRKAVMLEVLRVLAGFESSWRWDEGKDISNPKEDTQAENSAGIFQISADSLGFGQELRDLYTKVAGEANAKNPVVFQKTMKEQREFAIGYAARLLRRTERHNGPVRDFLINPYLRRGAMTEFMHYLAA